MAFELRADEDIGAPVSVWRGEHRPTQTQVDAAAGSACERGWTGTSLDLYDGDNWVEWVYPSEAVLS